MTEALAPMTDAAATDRPDRPYQVLARKYRPGHFRDLIGQEPMVRTLTNAFSSGRIAQAFVLTGVRGVGKTTTARIIAKGLNCTARDGPSTDPCGECRVCRDIAAGRHVEVIEMDAASNTGVEYVREINEAVRYRPAEVRYKVYIVDEVHMLSTSSFNALLKTLEEPPEHVVFILATTEIRKVPVTVLSRCQRFDLRRIEPETLAAHLGAVAEAEGARIEDGALGLIVRAAEGSVRDGLSLLDQAIRPGAEEATTAEEVRRMLGLADRGRVLDLFEAVMRGDAAGALAELSAQYADGADPAAVLRDLAETAHWLSVLRISPEAAEDPTMPADERRRGTEMAGRLPMRSLTRAWQMLLKALEEVPTAPTPMMAAEMALIRLSHVADLPPPEELVRRLSEDGAGAPVGRPAPNGPAGGPVAVSGAGPRLAAVAAGPSPRAHPQSQPRNQPQNQPRTAEGDPALAAYPAFDDVLALLSERREIRLLADVERHVSLVAYRPGLVEFHPVERAPQDLASRLAETLRRLTGARWSAVVTESAGAPTVAAERTRAEREALEAARGHPLVLAALETFPGAELRAVRRIEPDRPPAPSDEDAEYLAPVPDRDEIDGDLVDTDDPFEES